MLGHIHRREDERWVTCSWRNPLTERVPRQEGLQNAISHSMISQIFLIVMLDSILFTFLQKNETLTPILVFLPTLLCVSVWVFWFPLIDSSTLLMNNQQVTEKIDEENMNIFLTCSPDLWKHENCSWANERRWFQLLVVFLKMAFLI